MAFIIREADIKSDRDLLINALERFLTPLADVQRFDWLYYNNPHGLARSWVAFEADDASVVGIASAFPRSVYIGEKKKLAWVLGDFCINGKYRSLGPALKLQKACLEALSSDDAVFCYDLPNPGMTAVYKRLHIEPFGKMIRLVRPLRVNATVGRMVKNTTLARTLSAAGNSLIRFRDGLAKRTNKELAIDIQSGEFGDEFTSLAEAVGSRFGICTERSAEYLNWRYSSNTYCRYRVLTARRNGLLVAYAICNESEGHAILADLFGTDDSRVLSCLIEELVTMLRSQKIPTFSAPVFESHPCLPLLKTLGFWIRESAPVMLYPLSVEGQSGGKFGGQGWILSHGDRDS